MKKSLLIACLAVFAAALFIGCGAEAIKKLTEDEKPIRPRPAGSGA